MTIIVRESDSEVVAVINPKTYALTGCNDERLADQIETLAVDRRPLSELAGYQLVENKNGNPAGTE